MELVRFDTQLLENAEITGVEYQQGELAGYEVREYLLEKFNRTCAYCGAKDTPLEIEHITPKARGGSNRVSNLTLACHTCNQTKGSQTAAEFGHPAVQAKAKQPLKDAAAVNATRWAIWRRLNDTGLPVETGTGGRTKFNRTTQGYPKAHWIDAACVGESGAKISIDPTLKPLAIKAMGRGTRQMCRMDQYGFPRTAAKASKRVYGFQTGDMVQAIVPSGKNAGTHNGRVAVRAKGSFRVGKTDGIAYRHCRLIQRVDGYDYNVLPNGAISYPSPCVRRGITEALMSVKVVALPLPEDLYLRFQQTAQATRQSLIDVLLHAVQIGSPPRWEDAPAAFQAEVAALERLDDDALWRVARSRVAPVDADRMQELLDQNADDLLTQIERSELERLSWEADRLMLTKAHAAALLRWRGHVLPPAEKL